MSDYIPELIAEISSETAVYPNVVYPPEPKTQITQLLDLYQTVELFEKLEEIYSISVSGEEFNQYRGGTVGDVVGLVERMINGD